MSPLRNFFGNWNKVSILLLFLLFVGVGVSCGQITSQADRLLDAMEIETGSWVADVGSGVGTYTIPMAERVGSSGHVFAVDINHGKLEALHESLKENDLENVTTVYSVEENPMLPTSSLDAALARKAYHHFAAPQSMLRYIKAALKPDGRFVIVEFIDNSLVGESREEQIEEHDLGIGYVREELEAAGFAIQEEVTPLTETNSGFYWMIIATRPDS